MNETRGDARAVVLCNLAYNTDVAHYFERHSTEVARIGDSNTRSSRNMNTCSPLIDRYIYFGPKEVVCIFYVRRP